MADGSVPVISRLQHIQEGSVLDKRRNVTTTASARLHGPLQVCVNSATNPNRASDGMSYLAASDLVFRSQHIDHFAGEGDYPIDASLIQ